MKVPSEFNKQVCRQFNEEILNQIKIPAGIEMESAGGSFDAKTFTMKIKFTLKECTGKSIEEENYEFSRHAMKLPEWGFRFTTHEGEEYVMVGYKPRSRKYPIIAERLSTGKRFKFSAKGIKAYLGR